MVLTDLKNMDNSVQHANIPLNIGNTMAEQKIVASGNFDQTIVLGRLTADPELTHTTNGNSVCTFSVAVNRTWGSGADRRQKTEYYNCVQWGKGGEATAKYGRKGREVLAHGQMETRGYESNRFVDARPARELMETLKGQKTVAVEKVLAAFTACSAAKQSRTELIVRELKWQDAPPATNSAASEELPHPEEEQNTQETQPGIPF